MCQRSHVNSVRKSSYVVSNSNISIERENSLITSPKEVSYICNDFVVDVVEGDTCGSNNNALN